MSTRPAAFLDRDGVLVRDVDGLSAPEQVELLPCVPKAVNRLSAAGFAVVVVSNQPIVARGLAEEEQHAEGVWSWLRHGNVAHSSG